MASVQELVNHLPQSGTLDWIGRRPARGAAMESPVEVVLDPKTGIEGDRYQRSGGKRQVTLIQAEHLPVIAALADLPRVDPTQLRRNLVVRGINLLALYKRRFSIGGEVILETTGYCYPCSKMETTLGPGGYQATRGHGGITARIVRGGIIRIGDPVRALPPEQH